MDTTKSRSSELNEMGDGELPSGMGRASTKPVFTSADQSHTTEQVGGSADADSVLDKYFKQDFFSDFERYNVIKAMVEYASICQELSRDTFNDSADEILDKYYQTGMHWKSVNRTNVLKAMHEYASTLSTAGASEGRGEGDEMFNKEDMKLCYEAGITIERKHRHDYDYDKDVEFVKYINNIAR